MKITAKSWSNYIGKLAKVNQKAGSLMRKYVETNGVENTKALMDYAMALVQRYGEGSAELACQMYDAMAELSGVSLPAAEPAEVVKYKEVAKMVNATKNSVDQIERGVERLVKKAGADTTLKNAERDNAEFAWIPHGDTCAYCLALAAQGWRHVSLNTVGNGYGEHIHANCDCEYAVRFNKKTTVQGYDPDKYSEMFKNIEGNTEKDKINALRREKYAESKEILADKSKTVKGDLNLQFFAKIPDEKLKGYALNENHPVGKEKAKAFREALGYTQENYEELKNKILDSFNEDELTYKREDEYGKRYEQIMRITGRNGKTAKVVTVWIKESDASEPRMTSVYVDKRGSNEIT